jgi:hypothetical protein
MPHRLLSIVFACALAACGAAAPEPASDPPVDDDVAIQGGRRDPRHPAVGLVWLRDGGLCSGALIAPDVVLTAAHCVAQPVDAFYLGRGAPLTAVTGPPRGMRRIAAVAQRSYPGFSRVLSCPSNVSDLGLVRLESAVDDVAPLHVATTTPVSGTRCTSVGFGRHDAASGRATYAEKREAQVVVDTIAPTALSVSAGAGLPDHGDSGGPLICDGEIVGVTSCGDGDPDHVWIARADRARRFISAAWPTMEMCAHSICTPGVALAPSCDRCVDEVCGVDPYCCGADWDIGCVQTAGDRCGVRCE